VLTRPVGASFADYVAFPHSVGGLGAGHGPVALFLTFLIVIFVGYLTVTRKDVEVAPPSARPGHRRAVPSAAEYRPAHQGGAFDEQPDQLRPGRSPYRRGQFDGQRYQPGLGRSPYQRGPSDGEPYPPRPRDGEPRRPPEGFFAWDDG
jgi:hypothetical protein